MKYLAIDTSAASLTVLAKNGETLCVSRLANGAMQHSVGLMAEIDAVLSRAHLSPADCDFFACVAGPGSFTGVRIGIATVKGLCLAAGKPALGVTSFDVLAYAERGGKRLALVDAGHGCYYGCGFGADNAVEVPPAYMTAEETEKWVALGYAPLSAADAAKGLQLAVEALAPRAADAARLEAVYLRKSTAEEGR